MKTLETAASSSLATLVTEEKEDEYDNQYLLLDKLFKFLESDEELNSVLSGYFCKLVSILISRKQKMLLPYIFDPNRKVIQNLVKHTGQKSISEVLNKLLNQTDLDQQGALQT